MNNSYYYHVVHFAPVPQSGQKKLFLKVFGAAGAAQKAKITETNLKRSATPLGGRYLQWPSHASPPPKTQE